MAAAKRPFDALVDIADKLRATGSFSPGCVVIGGRADRKEDFDAEATAWAFVEPWSWTDTARTSDADGMEGLVVVQYRLTLGVSDKNPERRIQRLDLLHALAHNTLTDQCYAGFTLPARSRLARALWLPPEWPWRELRIAAEFAYLIHDTDADVTDTIDYIADR